MDTTEAADLARIILDDTETDRHMDLYTLTVIEARTLAHVAIDLTDKVKRMEALADKLEREAEKEREKPNRDPHDYGWDDACTVAAHRIRAALNGDDQ